MVAASASAHRVACGSLLGIDSGTPRGDASTTADGPTRRSGPLDGASRRRGRRRTARSRSTPERGCTPDPDWCNTHCGNGPGQLRPDARVPERCPRGRRPASRTRAPATTDPTWCSGRCDKTTDNCGNGHQLPVVRGGRHLLQRRLRLHAGSDQHDVRGQAVRSRRRNNCGLAVNCGVDEHAPPAPRARSASPRHVLHSGQRDGVRHAVPGLGGEQLRPDRRVSAVLPEQRRLPQGQLLHADRVRRATASTTAASPTQRAARVAPDAGVAAAGRRGSTRGDAGSSCAAPAVALRARVLLGALVRLLRYLRLQLRTVGQLVQRRAATAATGSRARPAASSRRPSPPEHHGAHPAVRRRRRGHRDVRVTTSGPLSSPATSMPFPPGDVLAGKYRVERLLGEGGMGLVVVATHLQLEQRVALKFLRARTRRRAPRPSRASSARRARRRASRASTSPASRTSARSRTARRTSSWSTSRGRTSTRSSQAHAVAAVAEAVEYVLQACEGLAEAHAPASSTATSSPRTSSSRGAATARCASRCSTSASRRCRAARRQLRRRHDEHAGAHGLAPLHVARADALVEERRRARRHLVAGRHPLRDARRALAVRRRHAARVCARIMAEPPTPLREARPDVPAALEAVVMRCLEKDPQRASRTSRALAQALAPFGAARGADRRRSHRARHARGRSRAAVDLRAGRGSDDRRVHTARARRSRRRPLRSGRPARPTPGAPAGRAARCRRRAPRCSPSRSRSSRSSRRAAPDGRRTAAARRAPTAAAPPVARARVEPAPAAPAALAPAPPESARSRRARRASACRARAARAASAAPASAPATPRRATARRTPRRTRRPPPRPASREAGRDERVRRSRLMRRDARGDRRLRLALASLQSIAARAVARTTSRAPTRSSTRRKALLDSGSVRRRVRQVRREQAPRARTRRHALPRRLLRAHRPHGERVDRVPQRRGARARAQRQARRRGARRGRRPSSRSSNRLTIAVAPTVPQSGLQILRDGAAVSPEEWGLAVPVDPGDHVVAVVSSPGHAQRTFPAHVGPESPTATVRIDRLDEPRRARIGPRARRRTRACPGPRARAASPPAPAASDPAATRRWIGVGVGGVGVVGRRSRRRLRTGRQVQAQPIERERPLRHGRHLRPGGPLAASGRKQRGHAVDRDVRPRRRRAGRGDRPLS